MNNKQREILHQHRHFLVKNIPWTDELANKLLAKGVITDSFLKETQNEKDNKQKGRKDKKILEKLLEILPLRGSGVFDKFCEVLLLNGHPFIADFLIDEENSNTEVSDLKELYKRIPTLEKHLKEADKRTLETFVNEKVKESNLKGVWSKEVIAREKDKSIEAKQKQLEDAFSYDEKEKQKNAEIVGLQKKVLEAKNEVIELKSQLGFMGSKLKETEDKFKSDFGVQIKYNNANENALRKLQEKNERCEELLQRIETGIKDCVYIPKRGTEREQMAVMEFRFCFLEDDFKKLVEKYHLLLDIEKQYDKLLHERNYILAHLGHSEEENKSLLNAYRDFAVKTDEDMMQLKEQLQKHNNIIEGQQEKIQTLNKEVETKTTEKKIKQAGTVWQNAMMSVMRKQLNDVKHEGRIKDTRIQHYESEVTKLKARISELEATRATEHARSDSASQNNYIIFPSMMSVKDDDSDISRCEHGHKRNSLLPPLENKGVYKSPVEITPTLTQVGHKRHGPKHTNSYQRDTWATAGNIRMPEGLQTHQLKIENKHIGHIGHDHKQGHMTNGLGGLKAMRGKQMKVSHSRFYDRSYD